MNDVKVTEVGTRDGFQAEAKFIDTAVKAEIIDALIAAGVRHIEATSFVSPKHVPQMADADEVFRRIRKDPGRTYLVLVPNERGLDRAMDAGVRAIAVFTAASEAFAKANIRMTIDESVSTFAGVVKRGKAEGMWVRAAVSTAFGCPFQGEVAVDDVVRVCEKLLALGVDELKTVPTAGDEFEAERTQWDDGNNVVALAPGVVEQGQPRAGDGAVVRLLHDDVLVGVGGHLRQVGDDHDLGGARQGREPAPDLDGSLPADPSVHLVEDQRGDGVGSGADDFDGEHDAVVDWTAK